MNKRFVLIGFIAVCLSLSTLQAKDINATTSKTFKTCDNIVDEEDVKNSKMVVFSLCTLNAKNQKNEDIVLNIFENKDGEEIVGDITISKDTQKVIITVDGKDIKKPIKLTVDKENEQIVQVSNYNDILFEINQVSLNNGNKITIKSGEDEKVIIERKLVIK